MHIFHRILRKFKRRFLDPNSKYWDSRYESGGNSGEGSFGKLAQYKAEYLNRFVTVNSIQSIVEFGCGDGNQLELYQFPKYLGLDISPTAVKLCRERFKEMPSMAFAEYNGKIGFCEKHQIDGDLALSIDVVFHLIHDEIYKPYMTELFSAGNRFVIVYSSNNNDAPPATHVRHRTFVDDVANWFPEWKLIDVEKNPFPFEGDSSQGSFADFHVFSKES